jgi:ATP-binding cassette subfamily A (ABC1) protein 3
MKVSLDILNIGISVTTLEEVFLRIGDNENTDDIDYSITVQDNSMSTANPLYNNEIVGINSEANLVPSNEVDDYGLWIGSNPVHHLVGPIQRLTNQFHILLKKRFIHSARNLTLIISQIVIPIAVLLINLIYLKYAPIKPGDSPLLKMDITRYANNFVPYTLHDEASNDSQLIKELSKIYASQFKSTLPSIVPFDLSNTSTVTLCKNERSSIDKFLTCLGRLSYNYIIDDYVIAADFTSVGYRNVALTGHFNNQPYHVPPLALNLLTNTLFKYYTNSSESQITVNNHPLPRDLQGKITDQQLKDMTGYNIGTGLTFGFSFLIASFVIFLIKEKSSSSKHLQYMSGANSYVFWISSLVWDIVNYMLAVAVAMLLLRAFNIMEFLGDDRWVMTLGMFILYGFAHISQMYLFSFLFKVSSTGFAAMVGWNILSSQATLTPVAILTLPQLDLVSIANGLEWLFIIILPNFAFGQGMIDMYSNNQTTELCKQAVGLCRFLPNPCCGYSNVTNPNRCGPMGADCLQWNENFMAWEKPGLLRFFVFMPIQFLLQFGLILIYEAGYFREVKYMIKSLFKKDNNLGDLGVLRNQLLMEEEYGDIKKDEDVINEEIRISNFLSSANAASNKDIFIINQLTKYYQDFMAVKGISFRMGSSECFGLLGVNGAGKTSTFKMITGDEFITKGDVYLNSTSIKSNIKKFQQQLGYCPQFDP